MGKSLIFAFLFILFGLNANAQCPYISGALIDAVNSGAGEGENEFISFTTGTSALAINSFSVGVGTSAAATGFTIDGATVTWQSLAALPAITNSAGTITNITTGSIPANTPVVILNSSRSVAYDFATFGPSVYVLVFSAPGTGISGYSSTGNLANRSSPSSLRYLRITAGACNNVVSYDKFDPALSNTDGAGAKWDATGTIKYANTGGSGAILPINLLSFSIVQNQNQPKLSWQLAENSTAIFVALEKSIDGEKYLSIHSKDLSIEAKDRFLESEFVDVTSNTACLYRLKIVNNDGSIVYSESLKSNSTIGANLLSIYPNPFTDILEIKNNAGTASSLAIYSLLGHRVFEKNLTQSIERIDLSLLPKGVYQLIFQTSSGTEAQKIVKQ